MADTNAKQPSKAKAYLKAVGFAALAGAFNAAGAVLHSGVSDPSSLAGAGIAAALGAGLGALGYVLRSPFHMPDQPASDAAEPAQQ
jgi:hypothetical protein